MFLSIYMHINTYTYLYIHMYFIFIYIHRCTYRFYFSLRLFPWVKNKIKNIASKQKNDEFKYVSVFASYFSQSNICLLFYNNVEV